MFALMLAMALASSSRTCHVNAAAGAALDAKTSIIHGQITDVTGASIPHALIMYRPASRDLPHYTIADENGCFQFTAPVGSYIIKTKSPGFRIHSKNIDIEAGKDTAYDTQMEIGSCGECVTVTPALPTINACAIDREGLPIPTAHFNINSTAGRNWNISVDEWGCISQDVVPGEYTLTLEAPGFVKLSGEKLHITDKAGFYGSLKLYRSITDQP